MQQLVGQNEVEWGEKLCSAGSEGTEGEKLEPGGLEEQFCVTAGGNGAEIQVVDSACGSDTRWMSRESDGTLLMIWEPEGSECCFRIPICLFQ